MVSLTDARLRIARARIASAVVRATVNPCLGAITLRSDQQATARRVLTLLDRHGGCLLADDVGSGKTFVALAVARRWARPLAVVPASLSALWTQACLAAGVSCEIVSHERLSRGWLPAEEHDGVIVDESHRFRSPASRRYGALTRLTAAAPVLLLSATPLQNRQRDLSAQIALFLGARAHRLGAAVLATFVVRGPERNVPGMPRVAPPRWVRPHAEDGAVLEALLALPPPPLPRDGGEAAALRTIGLVRAWASSRAALRDTLRQRRRAATAIEQSVMAGLVPSRRELRSWYAMDDTVQLGFAALLVDGTPDASRLEAFVRALRIEERGLDVLARAMADSDDPDPARADLLRAIRIEYSGERILAFTERSATARAYFRLLRADSAVGLLTAREARIASGNIAREVLLARFAPRARGVVPPPDRETVTLLLATDLLSEGVNLQDASVVVHLDLPWNPARLAQRVGRVRRPGGAPIVRSILYLPPARAEHLLDVETRLRRKLEAAESAIGRGIAVIPGLVASADPLHQGDAARLGEIASIIASWESSSAATAGEEGLACIIAGARSSSPGWLAMFDDGELVGGTTSAASDDPRLLLPLARAVTDDGCSIDSATADAAMSACARWTQSHALMPRLRAGCGA